MSSGKWVWSPCLSHTHPSFSGRLIPSEPRGSQHPQSWIRPGREALRQGPPAVHSQSLAGVNTPGYPVAHASSGILCSRSQPSDRYVGFSKDSKPRMEWMNLERLKDKIAPGEIVWMFDSWQHKGLVKCGMSGDRHSSNGRRWSSPARPHPLKIKSLSPPTILFLSLNE